MTTPSPTLRELTGMSGDPAHLAGSALVMIDLQNTYTQGVMALENVEPAIEQAAHLLERAREWANVLLEADPGLGQPEHVLLDVAVHLAYGADALAPIPA